MSTSEYPPPSPGVASRRPKAPPKLPLSAFTNTASSAFPLAADPTTVYPDSIIDANVTVELEEWKQNAGDLLKKPISGVVLSLHTTRDQPALDEKRLSQLLQPSSGIAITAVIAPTHLADRGISKLPAHITSSPSPIAFAVPFVKGSTSPDDIRLILSAGHVVDLDVPWDASQAEDEAEWDALEEVVGKAVGGPSEAANSGKALVISNLLPPPHSLAVAIVRLLTHPTYQAYQAHISSLSFVPNVYLKFLPPSWHDPTPRSPAPGASFSASISANDTLAKEEWKRRVKMYLGPALDAFGFERIIFGTSPSPSSSSKSTPHDWYALAREVVAELGMDQEGVNAIFGGNAKTVYSRQA